MSPGSPQAPPPGDGAPPQPEDAYFDLMASVAETHWWYQGRRELVRQLLAGRVGPDTVALDVGCGTSETLDLLMSMGARNAVGTDLSWHALGHAIRRRPRPRILQALAEHLPMPDASVGALVSMDVIEHVDDDVEALLEYARVCVPGATVLLTVPAYEWLWSDHDDRAAHRRRYTAPRLERAARDAGLVVERCSYYYSFLLPAAIVLRRTPLGRLAGDTDEEASSIHPAVDRVLAAMGALERRVLRHGRIPFGLSIVMVAHTPDGHEAATAPDPSGGRSAWTKVRGSARGEQWGRQARVARLTARRAAHFGWTKVRGRAAGEARRAELEERFAIRTAEDVATELGQMKGAAMKLGQMVGFVADGLPPAAQEAFAQLQQDVPPMAPSLAEEVVASELGARPDALFLDWDPVPVAAASIGQVHRAVMPDGRRVAVKVQYPGVDRAIRSDLDHAERLSGMFAAFTLSGVDVHALVDELRDRMADELDYRHEADAQEAFAARYRGHPFVRIPAVVRERSARRVLTSEWVDGVTFAELLEHGSPDEHQHVAEVLFRFAQGSLHEHRTFNGDPHPGNYRFHRDGTVTFLDFGLVKHVTDDEYGSLVPIIDEVLRADAPALVASMERAGFLHEGHGLDPDRVFRTVSAPYRAYLPEEFTFTPDYTRDALASLLDVRGPNADVLAALDMPPSFVLLDRVVWGVSSMLGRLHARNRWRGILGEYLHGLAPVTELGRREAAWRRERARS